MRIQEKTYARVGLLGNPSDGYHGKTISFSLKNFFAVVTLEPVDDGAVIFTPHPSHDPLSFESAHSLSDRVRSQGYYGGIRLLMALCHRFYSYCKSRNLQIDVTKGFKLSYDTNIPRQAGLSGSSAIICSALKCLLSHYNIESQVPVEDRPSLMLSAESELGITAGLQDRVIQVYGGLVYMDFQKEHLEMTGNGIYTAMDPDLLPPHLYIVFASNPSDSGKVHSDVKRRWLEGEAMVVDSLTEIRNLAAAGKVALEEREYGRLALLMDRNFDLRRKVFGDDVIGDVNLRMVELVRSVGAAAKFTGSGGALIAFCSGGKLQASQLEEACALNGFSCVEALVAPPN